MNHQHIDINILDHKLDRKHEGIPEGKGSLCATDFARRHASVGKVSVRPGFLVVTAGIAQPYPRVVTRPAPPSAYIPHTVRARSRPPRVRSAQAGSAGSCFRWSFQSTSAPSVIPMGYRREWPEFARCTASMASARTGLASSLRERNAVRRQAPPRPRARSPRTPARERSRSGQPRRPHQIAVDLPRRLATFVDGVHHE